MDKTLIITSQHFEQLYYGESNFHLTKIDYDLQVGDVITLYDNKFWNAAFRMKISCILTNSIGLENGYCILGLKTARNVY